MKYYTEKDIEKEIFEEIKVLKDMAEKSDFNTYFSWYYPLIKECLNILAIFNIKSFSEIDKIFDIINKEIKFNIGRSDQKCLN